MLQYKVSALYDHNGGDRLRQAVEGFQLIRHLDDSMKRRRGINFPNLYWNLYRISISCGRMEMMRGEDDSMFELILLLAVGGLFLWMGYRIWIKEQITLIHDYHYTKVKKEDRKPYTEKMGKAMLVMGAGICLTGVINQITHTGYGWIAFGICS